MKHRIILLLVAISLIVGESIGNNLPIGSIVEEIRLADDFRAMEINGAIKLYSILKEDIELIDTEVIAEIVKENANNWSLAYNRDYFIGYSDTTLELVTPRNFKRIAKKYFANIPELAASIGKRGFKYKNLPTIILYYNKQIVEGRALIKEDKLPIKEI